MSEETAGEGNGILSEICLQCGGRCCWNANPPLTEQRMERMSTEGMPAGALEFAGYRRLKARDDGFCVLFSEGRCLLHAVKPEICVAIPFTFDVKGNMLEIFLRKGSICPMVPHLLGDGEAYQAQYDLAVRNLLAFMRDVPEDELREILTIEEPETIKVGEVPLEGVLRPRTPAPVPGH
ncbi:MAG: YkgJ family cysteine cluster protein [Methanosarcinales archaeon]|nr:YkgJ family cysteine cluster protein [Methanosarcinales archaeon]